MDSKGMSMALVVTLIILAAALIILIPTIGNTLTFFESRSDIEACRQSVEIRANSKILGKELINSPLKCKPQQPVIIERSRNWEREAKEEMANAMYDCWYKFGAGELNFLGEYNFGGREVYCSPCATIVFDDSLKGEKLNGFYDYLENEGYADYLYKNVDEEKRLKLKESLNEIEVNDNLYIIYGAVQKLNILNNIIQYGNPLFGIYSRYIQKDLTGDFEYCPFLLLEGDIDNINEVCKSAGIF